MLHADRGVRNVGCVGVCGSLACTRRCLESDAALPLLFIGIHNAWDGVTYHVLSDQGQRAQR
jgi:hypothetical protein